MRGLRARFIRALAFPRVYLLIRKVKKGRVLRNKQSHKPVNFYHVDADHFSMIEGDDVKNTAAALSSALGIDGNI